MNKKLMAVAVAGALAIPGMAFAQSSVTLYGTIEEIMSGFETTTPARRLGEPEELAALITFLAGERAGYITGCSIPVDGGSNKSLL